MNIRKARADDAEAASLVLRRSITELCSRDHGDDPDLLRSWLANKTPEKFREWVAADDLTCFIAEAADGAILGIGLISLSGEIRLNYVSPDARFRRVSKTLIEALEDCARSSGLDRITLNSTATAHQFYLARGYEDAGPPDSKRLKDNIYPMAKTLAAPE